MSHHKRTLPRACILFIALSWPTAPPVKAEPLVRKTAPTQREVSQKQGNLHKLRGQIEKLRKEVARTEDQHAGAADQLKSIEKEISSSEQALRRLSQQHRQLQATLTALDQQTQALQDRLSVQQSQLEELIYRHYLRGNPSALKTLLNGSHLNQSMRDLYYLSALGQARRVLVKDIETTLEHKRDVAETTRARANDLAYVENRHKEQRDQLVARREQRKAVLEKMETQLATQRQKIGNLERDEKQLAQLVEQLNRAIAAQEAAARREAARQAMARRRAAQQADARQAQIRKSRQPVDVSSPPVDNKTLSPYPETGAVQAPLATGRRTQMRGRMPLPVRGTVTNLFGSARPEGGTWKGIFIRAATGSDVKAIADGRVVFADWMRGFGNLLIIDHGRGYLSIYGNNDALLKHTGDSLRGGDIIAAAGSSGGNAESGLYFEIRHQGKPIDPLRWVDL